MKRWLLLHTESGAPALVNLAWVEHIEADDRGFAIVQFDNRRVQTKHPFNEIMLKLENETYE